MDNQLADSKVLGYAAIFITGWIYSMFNAHWITSQMPEVDIVTGLILGGAVLSIVGILSYFRGETYEMTLFLGLGAFFFIVSLSNILASGMEGSSLTVNQGWIDIVWAVFFFYLWLAVTRKDIWVNLFMLGLWLTFLALAIGNWIMATFLIYIGGYLGLITSLIAGWLSASEIQSAVSTSTVDSGQV